jgi:uncharacterized protein (DUF1330 family)
MPKGYVIFVETVHDQAGYDGYVQKALPTIVQSGGTPIVAQDEPEVIEGEWKLPRTVILEFDSVDAARKWYTSPEYQAAIGERQSAADANAVIVSGFEMPTG